jgi:hypothetical protein
MHHRPCLGVLAALALSIGTIPVAGSSTSATLAVGVTVVRSCAVDSGTHPGDIALVCSKGVALVNVGATNVRRLSGTNHPVFISAPTDTVGSTQTDRRLLQITLNF